MRGHLGMRGHLWRYGLVLTVVVSVVAALGLEAGAATPAARPGLSLPTTTTTTTTAPAGPVCTFNGGSTPIATGVTDGSTVAIDCTGLPALTPFVFFETSLLIAVDPKAAPLLSGGDSASAATVEAALAALPEINPGSFESGVSNASGVLDENYTVPSTQPTDPNAACPPSLPEFNSGLIGCAVAMLDLSNQESVAAGSGLLEWKGYPFLPPNPTLALSTDIAYQGSQVTVSDQPGSTTYWWIATLAALEALLSGGAAPPETFSVEFGAKNGNFVSAPQAVTASAATYDGSNFTPPILSGSFTVPSTLRGKHKVYVGLSMNLEGFGLQITAEQPLTVARPKK
jgi:hypothetical protein